MRIDLLTLFPEFFLSPLNQSMLRRAQMLGKVEYRVKSAGFRHGSPPGHR